MSTLDAAVGPPMRIHRFHRFTFEGVRFRTGERTVYNVPAESTVVLRIGPPNSTAALLEHEADLNDSVPSDPSWYGTVEGTDTGELPASAGYQYTWVQVPEELLLMYGSCEAVDHPVAP